MLRRLCQLQPLSTSGHSLRNLSARHGVVLSSLCHHDSPHLRRALKSFEGGRWRHLLQLLAEPCSAVCDQGCRITMSGPWLRKSCDLVIQLRILSYQGGKGYSNIDSHFLHALWHCHRFGHCSSPQACPFWLRRRVLHPWHTLLHAPTG